MELKVITQKYATRKNLIYILIFIAVIFLVGFSGGEYINIRKERNKLKTSLKEEAKKYKDLELKYNNAIENEEEDQAEEYNYYYDWKREKKLRLRYEKAINIFVNYDNRAADSIISNYRFSGDR